MHSAGYDYIVVGGGTSGLVLASRLSEDPKVHVLVIEAGEDLVEDSRVKVPAFWPTLLNTAANWDFETVPQRGLCDRKLKFPQGRLLGGSGAINGLAFSPSSKSHLDAWAALGSPGWEWSSFAKSLANSYRLSALDKGAGPLQLNIPDDETSWPRVWRDTLSALGYPTDKDPFSGEFHGALTVPDSIDSRTKTRTFSANAYLKTARSRDNLVIWTNTLVEKILLEKGDDGVTATGVQVTRDQETRTVGARKEVLITSGSINSPTLLERSGIGSPQILEPLGIETVIANQYVGENLQNHPMISLQLEVHDAPGFETMDMVARQDPDATAAAMDSYSKLRGPFSNSETDSGLATAEFANAHQQFVRSVLESATDASAHYLTAPLYAGVSRDGSMMSPPPGTGRYFTIGLLLSHPLSRGSVHITSNSASAQDVAVDPNYFSNPLDIEIMAHHLRFLVGTLLAMEPLASRLKRREEDTADVVGLGSLDDIKDYLRSAAVGAHHYTGSCSMMPRHLGGVVDPRLRVYGCKNLRVCDASIMPITSRTNPQATVYGIAEHAARIIKEDN
ncbi:hypothetical protein F4778DRAFT_771383 [Xylariomycetidae sp. FL2044]|nr:hypothetical protein F4778DRAFT_771383 [Xylariomycetidae sp. FL2044]